MINQYQIDRIWAELREEIIDTADVFLSQGLAVSPLINEDLERSLCTHTGRKHAALVGNCTDGLFIALKTLRLPAGFRAAVPAMTWVSTASSIVRAGGIPVFYDIKENYTIDESADFSDIDVIVTVDLLGNSCNWDRLEQLGKPIVHDSAQSFGTIYQGKSSQTRGLISCTSFGPLKPLPSFGSGGCVFTDDDELNKEIKLLRLHYKRNNSDTQFDGPNAIMSINSCMNSFEVSAVGVCMKYYEQWRDRRQKIADYYYENFKNYFEFSRTPQQHEEYNSIYKLAMRYKKAKSLIPTMLDHGIQAQDLYIALTNEQRFRDYPRKTIRNASKYEFMSFTLPGQHTLTDSEVDIIVQELKKQL